MCRRPAAGFGSGRLYNNRPFFEDLPMFRSNFGQFRPISGRSRHLALGLAALFVLTAAALQSASPKPFELTVDSIMRGPKLVGYPQTGLPGSGDSTRLYFEWRRPGDDEAATYVVGKDGGEPRKLSDEERRSAPPVNGVWDKAHRRVLFVDQGDVVLLDTVSGTRRQITRTTGN